MDKRPNHIIAKEIEEQYQLQVDVARSVEVFTALYEFPDEGELP